MTLADETAIVTGAASGIGRAIARKFAAAGANVVVADVDESGGEETVASIREAGNEATFVRLDVRNSDDVADVMDAAVDTFGSLDVVVNNAGGSFDDDNLHKVSDETYETVVDVNLGGTFNCTRAAIPRMVETSGGSFVHVASVNGVRGIGLTSYSAAKAGILGLSRTVATQYGRHGIRSNCLVPGTIVTPANASKFTGEDNPFREVWLEQYPIGRLGRVEDTSEAALFLADDERAGFITGVKLPVDGGLTARGVDHAFEAEMFDVTERPTR
jgi:3-oxoacyl-[acyl-carrier protein] reductase